MVWRRGVLGWLGCVVTMAAGGAASGCSDDDGGGGGTAGSMAGVGATTSMGGGDGAGGADGSTAGVGDGEGGAAPVGGAHSCADPAPVVSCAVAEDCEAPDSECGSVTCEAGACVYESEKSGTACSQNDGRYCDGLMPASCQASVLEVFAGITGGPGDVDGVRDAARLAGPTGITYDGAGHLFIADGARVRRIELASGRLTTFAGALPLANQAPGAPQDGIGSEARFGLLADVTASEDGFLYVSETENHTIRRIDLETAEVTTLAGSPGVAGGVDAVGDEASFNRPSSLAHDGRGGLWVLDANGLRRVDTETGSVTTVVGAAGAGVTSDGRGGIYIVGDKLITRLDVVTGAATIEFGSDQVGGEGTTRFYGLKAATVDERGLLYVLQTSFEPIKLAGSVLDQPTMTCPGLNEGQVGGHDVVAVEGHLYVATVDGRVVRVAPGSGTFEDFVGSTKRMDDLADGVGSEARFEVPWGLTSDGAGSVYVAELLGGLRKVDLATAAVSTVPGVEAGPGATFYDGKLYYMDEGALIAEDLATGDESTLAGVALMNGSDDGIGPLARFSHAGYVVADGAGHLFVAESGDNRLIRRVEIATGSVTTLAGAPDLPVSITDGTGSAARFRDPTGIAFADGNLYVSDGPTIRQIVIASGAVTTLAGKFEFGAPTIVDGVGADATLISPQSPTVDAAGNLYFADWMTVRKLELATGEVTTVVGVSGSRGTGLGALPGSLTQPSGLLALPSGDLLIVDETVLLRARL